MVDLSSKEAVRLCRETEDISTIIVLTKHQDPQVRLRALKEICPCRVKDDIPSFWERVLEMVHDSDDNVREQVIARIFTLLFFVKNQFL